MTSDLDMSYADSSVLNKSNGVVTKGEVHLTKQLNFGEPVQFKRGSVVSSRLNQVTSFIAIVQLNFIKESTSYIHNTVLGISNTTFT